jgi:cell division protein FtsQ
MASSSDRRSGSSANSRERRQAGDARAGRAREQERQAARRRGQEIAGRKRAEREQRLASRRRGSTARIVLAAAAVVALVVGGVALYRSSAFAVTGYRLVGASHVKLADVLKLARVPAGATLIRFPSDEVRARVSADPWIAEVTVHRRFPDQIEFDVVERVPAALLDVSKALWVVDGGGWVVARQSANASSTLPVVRQVEGVNPKVGARLASASLNNALQVLQGISAQMRTLVRVVNAPSVDETALLTNDNVEILVGPATDLAKKEVVARKILVVQHGKVVFIDVRTPDRPVSRGLGQ